MTADGPPASPHTTFVDPVLERRFHEQGYVVLPLLTEVDLRHFRACFAEWYPERRGDFETTALNEHGDAHHLAVHHELAGWFQARIDEHFVDHGIRHAYFMCKRGGLPAENRSEVVLHQDWTYVDEPRVRGPLVWCPLVDVGPDNGWLEVVPGSHRFVDAPRGTGEVPWAFRDVEAVLRAHLCALPMRAGEVVVYDGALVHASPPNRSAEDRPVIGLGLAPWDVPLLHFHSPDGRTLERYEVEDDFYLRHRLGSSPDGYVRSVERQPLLDRPVDEAELAGWLAAVPTGP